MTEEKLATVQEGLNSGMSIYRIALNEEISEAAISYTIRKGNFKKLRFIRNTVGIIDPFFWSVDC